MLTLFDGGAIAALTMEHKLGSGRVDISCAGRGARSHSACLQEFKVARSESVAALERAAEQGLRQTRDNDCAAALLESNPALQSVCSYGIGCRRRACRVRVEKISRQSG